LHLPPTQYGLLSWDVFKAHCTQAVLDLLEARYIKVVYVPGNCTSLASANDHPEFNKNVKDLNTNKFTRFYADKVAQSLADGEDDLFIQFPAAEMKPLHAKWTADSLEYVGTQQHWMESALRGVGIWSIFDGTFVPDPLLAGEFWAPTIATAEEAAIGEPPSESEDEFVENSEDEPDPADQFEEEEEEVNYNLEDEVSSAGNRTPVFATPRNDDETESEEEDPIQPSLKRTRTLLQDSDDDISSPKLKEDYPHQSIPQTQMNTPESPQLKQAHPDQVVVEETQAYSPLSPPLITRTSRTSRAVQQEEEEVQRAIAASLVSLSRPGPSSPDVLRSEDDEGIAEEETALFQKNMMQQGQWRVVHVNESWQLAKRLLLPPSSLPPKTRKHPSLHSYIVSRNVMPSKVTKIKGDGACMFRAISFGMFRTEDCHRAVREHVLAHMEKVWDMQPRLRLIAAMKYQEKTGLQRHVRPSSVVLSARDYITATKMDQPYTWGGSTELEAAADWLQTPIKVFHYGNPKFPPKSWITYGSAPEYYNSHVLLLQWTNQDHYDYVAEVV